MTAHNQKRNVVGTRLFEALIEQGSKAWVELEMVKSWWGPTGFTCAVADMDFREGETALVCMGAPKEYGGQDMYNTWNYQKILPVQGIEFVQNFADKDSNKLDLAQPGVPAGVPEDAHHVVSFKDAGDGRTETTVSQHGYTSEQAHDLSKLGLLQCLDKIGASFAGAWANIMCIDTLIKKQA